MWKLESSGITSRNESDIATFWKSVPFFFKLCIEVPHDLVIPLLGRIVQIGLHVSRFKELSDTAITKKSFHRIPRWHIAETHHILVSP